MPRPVPPMPKPAQRMPKPAAADAEAGRAGPAGQWRLAASAFTWVDTGDPMPAGLDTVVERERVRLDADGSAEITGAAPRGLHVRARGEDFGAGELLVPAGHLLRPADLAAAATAGHVTLQVARRPVAAIIPTGDEIAPIGATLRPGDVVDSNSLMLASRASQVGARPLISDVQPDDPDAIAAEVRRTALTADIVLIIAGSSAGRSDYAAAVLAQVGGLAVRGVAVRPGHPVLLGYASRNPVQASRNPVQASRNPVQASRNPVQASRSPIQADRSPIQADRNPVQADRNPVQADREPIQADREVVAVPVIGIPGYPLAAAVIFELFAVPLLAALQGRRPTEPRWQRAELACDWTSPPDVEDWVPVSLTAAPAGWPGGRGILATPSGRGAGSIARLMRADAWWPIPIGQARFARGEPIDVQPVPGAPQ